MSSPRSGGHLLLSVRSILCGKLHRILTDEQIGCSELRAVMQITASGVKPA
jgi:hypothetical protein